MSLVQQLQIDKAPVCFLPSERWSFVVWPARTECAGEVSMVIMGFHRATNANVNGSSQIEEHDSAPEEPYIFANMAGEKVPKEDREGCGSLARSNLRCSSTLWRASCVIQLRTAL